MPAIEQLPTRRTISSSTTPVSTTQTTAAEYVLEVRDRAGGIDGAVATVGQLELEPGAANVVPSSVRLTVDARAPDQERLDRLVAALGLEEAHYRIPPVAMSEQVRQVLREEIERAGEP